MSENDHFQKLNELLSIQDVLDNLNLGIIIYDREGNFLFVNTVMVNWRNIPRSEYLKKNVHDFNDVLDVCVFDLVAEQKRPVSRLQYYKNFEETGSALSAEARCLTAAGNSSTSLCCCRM